MRREDAETETSTSEAATELPTTGLLQGWRAIAGYLSAKTGLAVTRAAALKWSHREHNPLPVKRFGDGRRPRVVAEPEALDRWANTQWQQSGGK